MKPYGCWNQPRDTHPEVLVQDGWTGDGRRRMVSIPNFGYNSVCTVFDSGRDDERCNGCRHKVRLKGE